jgi:pimeloyl-ACP methyl ester carboxylesterase
MSAILSLLTQITGISRGISAEKLYAKYKTEESAILEVEGMPLHYRVTGQGPNLLLLHGVTSSLHTWNGWHDCLSTDFRVISFDLPSFGLTGPHPQGDYSLEMYFRVIDALLDHLKVDKTYVAGNSFGGYLTWNYALHNSDRVMKIALLNAAGIDSKIESLKDIGFKMFLNPFTKTLAHWVTPRSILKQSLYNAYGDSSKVTEELIDTYHHMLLRKGNREGFSDVLRTTIFHGKDNTVKIKKIIQPTLIMWGKKDKLIRVKDASIFNRLIPNSTLIIYDNIGHVPMEEIPNQSSADVKTFFFDNTREVL